MPVVNGCGEVDVQELELEWVHVVQEHAVLRLAFLGPGVEWLNGPSHFHHHVLPKHSPSPPQTLLCRCCR